VTAFVRTTLVAAMALACTVITGRQSLAASALETSRQWGLIGTWAVDCQSPPGERNIYLTYEIGKDGKLLHKRDFGVGQDTNDVLRARVASKGELQLVVNFSQLSETRTYTLMMGGDGRIRALTNRDSKGRYTIRNGRLLANGNPTPWQSRCR
jgi:hypothetical protein